MVLLPQIICSSWETGQYESMARYSDSCSILQQKAPSRFGLGTQLPPNQTNTTQAKTPPQKINKKDPNDCQERLSFGLLPFLCFILLVSIVIFSFMHFLGICPPCQIQVLHLSGAPFGFGCCSGTAMSYTQPCHVAVSRESGPYVWQLLGQRYCNGLQTTGYNVGRVASRSGAWELSFFAQPCSFHAPFIPPEIMTVFVFAEHRTDTDPEAVHLHNLLLSILSLLHLCPPVSMFSLCRRDRSTAQSAVDTACGPRIRDRCKWNAQVQISDLMCYSVLSFAGSSVDEPTSEWLHSFLVKGTKRNEYITFKRVSFVASSQCPELKKAK